MQPTLKELVIVGGGSAGWMTAAALSSLLDPAQVSVTLLESDQIGTVGVGEATIPDIINFNRILGIKEDEFMRATQATFKLGIEFVDWGRKGDTYLHPFGGHGVDMKGIDFHQFWLAHRASGNNDPIQDFSICAVAAKRNRFVLPDNNPRSLTSHLRYAYHFDATLYAKFLRAYAEARGVKRIEGQVEEVLQDAETGHIAGLRMENGSTVTGEFFFDCTGFRGLLIDRTLGVPVVDWRHWLPCDRALAVPCRSRGPMTPYTRSTAKTAGWQWRIPTQLRTGNGHIYCSDHMSDDEATRILLESLDGEPLADPRPIKFTTGHRRKFWEKNCIAIGLSAGFLEPLESTSLYLIQQGISRFVSLYPDASLPDVVRDEYNRFMRTDFEQVRDFIILHYHATERRDTPFWEYCGNMEVPESLQHKIKLFRAAGRVYRYNEELFDRHSWVAVFLGQNVMPERVDPIVQSLPRTEVVRSVRSMQTAMAEAAERMPPHEEFIRRYCPATAA